jgi:hypothetical protein
MYDDAHGGGGASLRVLPLLPYAMYANKSLLAYTRYRGT